MLIRDGYVVSLGSTRRLENLREAKDALDIPVHGKVIMPAFADAGLTVSREARPDNKTAKRLPPGELYDETLAVMRSCLQHGTSSADIKAHGDATELRSVVSTLNQIARIGNNPVDIRATWHLGSQALGAAEFERQFGETLEVLLKRKLASAVELLASDAQADYNAAVLNRIQSTLLGLKVHWPGDSLEALRRILARTVPKTVYTPVRFSDAAIAPLASSQSIILLAPGAAIGEDAENQSSARKLLDAGAAIALSSGYDRFHPNSFSMQMAIALAVLRLRFTVEEAISAATINAAHASGCGHLMGSLEVGKVANVLLLNVSDYREMARSFGINHVGMVIKNGNVTYNRTSWRVGTR